MESSKKRKAYHAPALRAYGDIRALTQETVKGGTAADDAGKPQTRNQGPKAP